MKSNKTKYRSFAALAVAVFVVSPLDDVLFTSVFGGAIFGFGSTAFYLILEASSVLSMVVWKRHWLAKHLRHIPKSKPETENFLVQPSHK